MPELKTIENRIGVDRYWTASLLAYARKYGAYHGYGTDDAGNTYVAYSVGSVLQLYSARLTMRERLKRLSHATQRNIGQQLLPSGREPQRYGSAANAWQK